MAAIIGALRVSLGLNAGEFSNDARRAGGAMDGLAGKAKKLGAAIGAAFALGQVKSFAQESIRLFGVQQDAIASVEAVLKTTGGTAGFTSKRLQEIASALQDVTTFGDEEILRGATSNLLTFGNIVGPVFERAQRATLDLSQQFNVGLKESAIQLGKALNDPIVGISALSRVGIAFTQQQKDQIKTLIESGKVMEAQGVILDEIEKFYGDAAEAAARTTAGEMKQAANAFGDAMETIGQALAPVVVPASRAIKDLSVAFAGLSPEARRFIVVASGATVVLGGMAAGVGILVAALGAIAGPITLAVGAIGLFAGAVAANWRGITNLASSIGEAFKGIYESARRWLVDAFEPIVSFVQGIVQRIGSAFSLLRSSLGLDEATQSISEKLKVITDVVDERVARLSEIWSRGATEGEALAQEVAPKMAMPIIEVGNRAKEAAKAVEDARKKVLAEQEQLIQEGLQLVQAMASPQDILIQKAAALDLALAKNRISAEQFGQAMFQATAVAVNSYASMASGIANNLANAFGESKAFAIAAAVINTAESITKTLATYGATPWGFAAAAAAAAAGVAQIAAIKNANKGSGSSGGSSTATAAASTEAATAAPQQSINISLEGEKFGRESVRGLITQINQAIQDGAVLRVATA